jgi:hypothetical protein
MLPFVAATEHDFVDVEAVDQSVTIDLMPPPGEPQIAPTEPGWTLFEDAEA